MHRADPRLSRFVLAALVAGGVLAAPAAYAAARADYYLKLPPIEGESGDKHKGEIEILSWSWGASQASSAHSGGGMGAGKATLQDVSVTPRPAEGKVEHEWKVEEGESASPKPGQAETTLKGSATKAPSPREHDLHTTVVARSSAGTAAAAAGGTEDINIGVGELAGKRTPPTVTLKRGMTRGSDGQAASGLATGKRQHKPMTMTMGSLSVDVPAGMCRAGARYPNAEFGTPQGALTLDNVVVASCTAAAGSAAPTETMSLNYEKIR